MIKNYPNQINRDTNICNQPERSFLSRPFAFLVTLTALLTLSSYDAIAQTTYTLGTGTTNNTTLGVTPFSTTMENSRSQYIYLKEELLDQGAISGNIIEFGINITMLALPAEVKPENVTIKMGMTYAVTLGETLVPGLQTYYSAPLVNITSTGWHTFVLDAPFEWDGVQNIIVEICRSNTVTGTSFGVQSTLFPPTDYRTAGLYTTATAVPGCSLTGTTPMIFADRRARPNGRFTMTNPCSGTPDAGTTAVSNVPSYCSETPFTLSVANGAIESNLAYQWQWAPSSAGPWYDLPGGVNTVYTTTQSTATWYRRATTCLESFVTANSAPLEVGGIGCYCTADVSTENNIGITNVSFGTINNSSSALPSFTNFTSISTVATKNSTYVLSANVNTMGGTNYTRAWIDWNNNGLYEVSEAFDLGTVTGGSDVNSGATASITIPSTATPGMTKMRVRTRQSASNEYPSACGAIENGEAEDYMIDIQPEAGVGENTLFNIDLLVFGTGNGLQVNIKNATMASVSVYDISGRLIASADDINSDSALLSLAANRQVVIVKVKTTEGAVINKKVIL